MSNLLVEIGNTALKACRCDGMTLGKTYRYQGEKVIDFIISIASREKPDVMVVSCVYPVSASDIKRLEDNCGKLLILDSEHTGILESHSLPSYLTYDRAASVIAVRYLFKGKGVTLFDLGTTLTVDITDSEGRYLGGNVSLGLRTRIKALNRYSKALPLVNVPSENFTLGSDIVSSIQSGVIEGIMFEIQGYTGQYPGNITVFTGGDTEYFAKRTNNSIFAVSNLVMMGLALIAEEYA